MWRIPWTRRIGVRLPPYDHPHAAPCNSPAFRVDRRQAVGGVCEQTNPALLNYIYRFYVYNKMVSMVSSTDDFSAEDARIRFKLATCIDKRCSNLNPQINKNCPNVPNGAISTGDSHICIS